MKRTVFVLTCLLFTVVFTASTACRREGNNDTGTQQPVPDGDKGDEEGNNTDHMNRNLEIEVGGEIFAATLEENAAARAFAALLPMTITMNDVNRNEKCFYLDGTLPVSATRPGTIRSGDLMLWGNNCVVLFYETFASSYSYTRLGRLKDATGLTSALGSGSVTVTFRQ